jgi:ubiquinone/menaquinone biosynthesis C-methylase UbiE
MIEGPTNTTLSMKRLLADAGVGAGMRVIDLGCGTGEVTRLIAQLVGDDGHVIGVQADRASPLPRAGYAMGEI